MSANAVENGRVRQARWSVVAIYIIELNEKAMRRDGMAMAARCRLDS